MAKNAPKNGVTAVIDRPQVGSACHNENCCLPAIKFEDQKLTSYAGLALFQSLFASLGLKEQLTRCFRRLTVSPIFGHGIATLLLVAYLLLGHRRLQDIRYYQDDPLVKRLLGLSRLPDVTTVNRTLPGMDQCGVEQLRQTNRQLVASRLQALRPAQVTLDFDGSVIATGHLTKPQGCLTLTMSANPTVKSELLHYMDRLQNAA